MREEVEVVGPPGTYTTREICATRRSTCDCGGEDPLRDPPAGGEKKSREDTRLLLGERKSRRKARVTSHFVSLARTHANRARARNGGVNSRRDIYLDMGRCRLTRATVPPGGYMIFREGVELAGLERELLEKLSVAESLFGETFHVTSGYREGDNRSHGEGLAVDIAIGGSAERFAVVKALIRAGFWRIGVYDKHVHADMSRILPYPTSVQRYCRKSTVLVAVTP